MAAGPAGHRQGRLILVNINPAYRGNELQYALNKVECRALIVSPRFKSSDYLAILRELAPELGYCKPGSWPLQRFRRSSW